MVSISDPTDPSDEEQTVTEVTSEGASGTDGQDGFRDGISGTVRTYLADHVVHLAVIVFFGLYPFIYNTLVDTRFGTEFDVVFPGMSMMVVVLYIALFAMSFDFISGYMGYLSFGHALFYGAGAYFILLAASDKVPLVPPDMGFMFLLVLAGLLGFVIAFAIGSVSFRLTGVYFALITLGFAELGRIFIGNWDHVGSSPRTGIALVSPDGFAIGIPFVEALQLEVGRLVGDTVTYDPLVIELSATDVSYYAIGAVVLVCYCVMQRIIHSPFGDVMMAIRDNEERANAVGYNTYWYKMVTFGISGFFAAVAGGLFAAYRRSVTPDNSMGLFVTADALVASLLGGVGTLAGAFYGYVFHGVLEGILTTGQDGLGVYLSQTLPDSLLSADVFGLSLQWVISNAIIGRAQLYLGIVFILFVLYVPGGFLGRVRARVGGKISEWSRMKTRRFWGR